MSSDRGAKASAYRAAMKDLHAGAQARANDRNRKAAREEEERAKRADAHAKGPRKAALWAALVDAFYAASATGLATHMPGWQDRAETPEQRAAVETYRAAESAYEACPLKD
jgi:hypothetical protein